MKDAGLRVPSQIASDLEQGFFLMEDMGDVLLSSQLDRTSVDAWYGMALTDSGHAINNSSRRCQAAVDG